MYQVHEMIVRASGMPDEVLLDTFSKGALVARPHSQQIRPQRSARAQRGRSHEAHNEKSWIAPPARGVEAPRRVRNRGVESLYHSEGRHL